jgi:hypothetical protein
MGLGVVNVLRSLAAIVVANQEVIKTLVKDRSEKETLAIRVWANIASWREPEQ